MADMLPLIGAKGVYKLNAPFDKDLLPNNVAYTCIAIRQLRDVTAAGGDPFNDYYVPKNLDSSVFTRDLANGVSIVTLQAEDNSVVYVPSSYLAAYPDGGGIPYRVMVLSINLGAVPDSLDLSPISAKIASDVKNIVGVDSTVRALAVSNTRLLDTATAQNMENARQANITDNTTDWSKYQQAVAERDAALQKVNELENYILGLQGAAAVPPAAPPADPSNGSST